MDQSALTKKLAKHYIYCPHQSGGKVMFLHLCVILSTGGHLSRGWGLCPGGGVSVQGGLCQGDPTDGKERNCV